MEAAGKVGYKAVREVDILPGSGEILCEGHNQDFFPCSFLRRYGDARPRMMLKPDYFLYPLLSCHPAEKSGQLCPRSVSPSEHNP